MKMGFKLGIKDPKRKRLFFGAAGIFIVALIFIIIILTLKLKILSQDGIFLFNELNQTKKSLDKNVADLAAMKKRDEYVINKKLEEEIKNIHKTYSGAVSVYEDLLKLKELNAKTPLLDQDFTKALVELSNKNYASAEATLASLKTKISDERVKLSSSFAIPANAPKDNIPPGAGYKRQAVTTDAGTFLVDIIAADLNSTRVVVDTASDGTCGNDCPVMGLAAYAGRSGAFAGINGPYFCPATYPSCQDKKNAFDTLLMNKNKTYFNSDNNVYSSVPAVIFSGSSARYVGASKEWGRDTGVDAVIANQPLLVSGGNVVFGGDDEAKRAGAGARSFIGSTGSTVYIGVVQNANVAQVARVVKAMGIENALNLDSGGSTALWSGGRYIVGPGRDTPFGILFIHK